MSKSEQQQRTIICVEHEYDTEYELNTSDQSPIDLQDYDDFPQIQKFIKVMLKELNKYHRCQLDSDSD